MWRTAVWVGCCGLLVAANSAVAQDAALDQIYGRGVSAYYSRDYTRAYNLLSSAVGSGSTDPRVYYFRGLSEMFLGRQPDAQLDFRRGREIGSDRVLDVLRRGQEFGVRAGGADSTGTLPCPGPGGSCPSPRIATCPAVRSHASSSTGRGPTSRDGQADAAGRTPRRQSTGGQAGRRPVRRRPLKSPRKKSQRPNRPMTPSGSPPPQPHRPKEGHRQSVRQLTPCFGDSI